MRSRPEVTTRSPTATSARSETYLSTRSSLPDSLPATWPETTPLTRLRSTSAAIAAVAVEQHLDARGVRSDREHAPDDAGGADHGGVELDPVLLALVERDRPEPGHAVAADHLRRERVERDALPQLEQLAQAHRLLGLEGAQLQLGLERAHLLAQPAVLGVGLAVERPAAPELRSAAERRADAALQRTRARRAAPAAAATLRCRRPPGG